MISLLLILAIGGSSAADGACVSAAQAEALGLSRQELDAQYAPTIEGWNPDHVAAVWQGFILPLREIGGSLSAYFAEDGSIDLIIVDGDDRQAGEICDALTRHAYHWPLPADRRFRQCGSVPIVPDEEDLELRATWEGAVVDFQLVNVSAEPQPLVLAVGGLWEDLAVFVWPNGAEEPQHLVYSARPLGIINRRIIAPGERVGATIDLAECRLYPSGQTLGTMTGRHTVRALYSVPQQHFTSWYTTLWSEPLVVEVREGEPRISVRSAQ
jgi:hypothetical protein